MLGRDMTIVLAPNLLLGHQVSAWCGPRITTADKRTNPGSEDEYNLALHMRRLEAAIRRREIILEEREKVENAATNLGTDNQPL